MKSSHESDKMDKMMVEHGRAIAHGMEEVKMQKEKNMAKAEKRKKTMLHRAAEIEIGRNYS